MSSNSATPRGRGWLSPFVHLSNNWISLAGVIIVTTATIFWLFLLPITLRGETENPYVGILAFLTIPGPFFGGLILIPLGIWLKRRKEGRAGIYPADFPTLTWANPELRRLVYFVGATTVANIAIASQLTYGMVSYMDTPTFCGQTCHTVMQPEYTAYINSPHSRVDCVKCHIGPGAGWFVKSKLSGVGQVVAVTLHTYPTPIPTPVHNLRPARETCEACHWPQKYGEDRVRVINKFADDETNSVSKTVLLMKIGGGNHGIGIHGTHLGPGVTIRYQATDEKRQNIPWVEYTGPGRKTLYVTADAKPPAAGSEPRVMDCMDCHNRPAHTFAPSAARAIDEAISEGLIPRDLPFVRREAVAAVSANYGGREAAMSAIASRLHDFYKTQSGVDSALVDRAVAGAQNVWAGNVFPAMRVTWGTYPSHIGHVDSPGCFRCHDDEHKSKDGKTIGQDCELCHAIS